MSTAGDAFYLIGAHCVSAAGTGIAAALGAVQTGTSAAVCHAVFGAPGRDGAVEPIYCAPVLEPSTGQRHAALLEQLLATMPPGAQPGAEVAWLALPGADDLYGQNAGTEPLVMAVSATLGVPCRAVPAATGTTVALTALLATMEAEDLQSAWLIGADSLLDMATIYALQERQPLQRQSLEGLVPGEAAAAVLLSRRPPPHGCPALVGYGSSDEPAAAAGGAAVTGLSAAIEAALRGAGRAPEDVHAVYSDDAGDAPARTEWVQSVARLWPNRLPEDQYRAMELGLIEPVPPPDSHPPITRVSPVLGAVGAASLPLQLALVAGWRHWQERWRARGLADPADTLLVCEHPQAPHRHAIVIT